MLEATTLQAVLQHSNYNSTVWWFMLHFPTFVWRFMLAFAESRRSTISPWLLWQAMIRGVLPSYRRRVVQFTSDKQADVVMVVWSMHITHTNLQQNSVHMLLLSSNKHVDGILHPRSIAILYKFYMIILTCAVRGEAILCIHFGEVSPTSLGMSVPCKSFPTTSWHLPLICNQQAIHNFIIVILICNVEWGCYSSCDVHWRWTRLTCSCYYKSDVLPYT